MQPCRIRNYRKRILAHGKTMADAVLPALIELQLEFLKPIGVGILGPEITPCNSMQDWSLMQENLLLLFLQC